MQLVRHLHLHHQIHVQKGNSQQSPHSGRMQNTLEQPSVEEIPMLPTIHTSSVLHTLRKGVDDLLFQSLRLLQE